MGIAVLCFVLLAVGAGPAWAPSRSASVAEPGQFVVQSPTRQAQIKRDVDAILAGAARARLEMRVARSATERDGYGGDK